jgi:hypothetical protein
MNLPEIRTNQFITGLPIPRMHLCSRPENQIAVCIKRPRQPSSSRLRCGSTRSRASTVTKNEYSIDVSYPQKTDSLPGSVIASTILRKFQRHRYPPDLGEQPRFAKPCMSSTNERSNKQRYGRRPSSPSWTRARTVEGAERAGVLTRRSQPG